MIDMPKGTQSYNYDCGIKVLQLVMAYYNVAIPYFQLLKKAANFKRYGIPEEELVKIAKRNKFNTIAHNNFTLDMIKEQIDKKRPVIVLLQGWADHVVDWKETNDFSHYSIIVGFEKKKVIFNDPLSFKKAWLTEKEFIDRWHTEATYHYACVAYKRKPANGKMEHMW